MSHELIVEQGPVASIVGLKYVTSGGVPVEERWNSDGSLTVKTSLPRRAGVRDRGLDVGHEAPHDGCGGRVADLVAKMRERIER